MLGKFETLPTFGIRERKFYERRTELGVILRSYGTHTWLFTQSLEVPKRVLSFTNLGSENLNEILCDLKDTVETHNDGFAKVF